jgi:hypothetical protein
MANVTDDLIQEENRKIRLLRMSTDMVVQQLMTQPITFQEADRMIVGVRRLASHLFPGKEHVFDLVYLPRFRRALIEAGAKRMPPSLEFTGSSLVS